MRLVRIPRRRFEEWLRTLDLVEEYSRRLREKLGRVTVVLYGSYARGDYNLWSDIDIIIVSERFQGVRILDRYDMLPPPPPRVEPVPLTPREFAENLGRDAWVRALRNRSAVVVDDYGLAAELRGKGITVEGLSALRRRIERLMEKYSDTAG